MDHSFDGVRALVAELSANAFAEHFARSLPARLGRSYCNVKIVLMHELPGFDASDHDRFTDADWERLFLIDALALAAPKDDPTRTVLLAVEISKTVDAHDVSRIAEWAGLLRRAGYDTVPVGGGEEILRDARELAGQLGVEVRVTKVREPAA